MHLLSTSSTGLDDIVEPVDLGQPPGDIAILSFADSDLAGLAAAWDIERDALPSVRLVQLRDLKHPMSVDLWIERVANHAKVIVVRLLGGLEWWRYGVDRLSALPASMASRWPCCLARTATIRGWRKSRQLPAGRAAALLRYFREGGRDNLRALLRRLARHAGAALDCAEPRMVPRTGGYTPGRAGDRSRSPVEHATAGQARHPDRVLSIDAAGRGCRADRRALRGAGRARPGAGAAVRHEPQGSGVGSISARCHAAA